MITLFLPSDAKKYQHLPDSSGTIFSCVVCWIGTCTGDTWVCLKIELSQILLPVSRTKKYYLRALKDVEGILHMFDWSFLDKANYRVGECLIQTRPEVMTYHHLKGSQTRMAKPSNAATCASVRIHLGTLSKAEDSFQRIPHAHIAASITIPL